MAKKKPRHKKSIRTTLTKEVADSLVKKTLEGIPLFTDEEYKTNSAVAIPIKDGVFSLKPATYRFWMTSRVIIPATTKTFYQVIQEARFERRMKKHEEEKKTLVLEAQNHLRALQKLPLGTETRRILKKSRVISDNDGGTKMAQTHQEEEVISTPVDPRMVVAKSKGSEFVLQALDPRFKKDDKGTVNVMVNLGDLRKEKEARDEVKTVPKADYKVVKEEK